MSEVLTTPGLQKLIELTQNDLLLKANKADLGTMAGESTTDWQPKLNAGSGIDITNNVISADNVFTATVGTTTYADVEAAYNAGYEIIAVKSSTNDLIYRIVKKVGTGVTNPYFEFHNNQGDLYSIAYLYQNTGWSTPSTVYLQTQLGSISVNEGITGSASNQRTVRADYLKQIIQGTTLTGIVFTDTNDVIASDSITTAIGKLQAKLADAVQTGHEVIAFQAPTAQNNYTWYRKYADGWVEQGGITNAISVAGNSGTNVDVTLPITMADTNYNILTTRKDGGSGYAQTEENTNAISTSVIRITLWNNVSGTASGGKFWWEVKGMAA